MKIIIGLGNPGRKYQSTRHNIGFMVLNKFADDHKLKFKSDSKLQADIASGILGEQKFILVKPNTYMNLSGLSAIKVLNFYKADISDVLVISDDTNIPVGDVRIRESGGHGGHNGLRSIIEQTSADFKRIRIGVGSNPNIALEKFVLAPFGKNEIELVRIAALAAVDAIGDFIKGETLSNIMNKYNTKQV